MPSDNQCLKQCAVLAYTTITKIDAPDLEKTTSPVNALHSINMKVHLCTSCFQPARFQNIYTISWGLSIKKVAVSVVFR